MSYQPWPGWGTCRSIDELSFMEQQLLLLCPVPPDILGTFLYYSQFFIIFLIILYNSLSFSSNTWYNLYKYSTPIRGKYYG